LAAFAASPSLAASPGAAFLEVAACGPALPPAAAATETAGQTEIKSIWQLKINNKQTQKIN